ncbi:Sphingosine-1-phosphate lyase [Diplonema papillatum]|nr:Sphingosine-1-phosphate lyase [Diplonema papillatum]
MSIAHALSAPTILADAFNEHLQGSSPLRIVVLTVLAVHCWRCLSLLARLGWHDSADAARQLFFWYLRRYLGRFLPLERALTATRKSFARDFAKKQRAIPTHFAALPRQGIPKTELLASCTALRGINSDYSKGQASGCVYHGGADGYTELINEAMALHQWTNPLHAGQFAGVRRMEIEVIAMVVGMFHGDDDACGALTSGGTESILLAMKAYRDMAFDQRCVSQPEIVLPETAHAAFFKAADYFKIRARKARVDPETCKVDMAHLRSLITSNTVALVASAPQYPHGIVDPIEQIAALGVKHGIPVHVDACLGGFLLPFMRAAGFDLGEGFDFRVAGVTSISCDTHKYGFAPKGSSVILYRSRDIRKYQMHAVPDWPGGIYASPIISGTPFPSRLRYTFYL